MVLENELSAYNMLLSRPRPKPTAASRQIVPSSERPRKRLKPSVEESEDEPDGEPNASPPSPLARRREIPDSDTESGNEPVGDEEYGSTQRTDLEQALLPIKADKEAIEEYETMRASQSASTSSEFHERFGQREWVPGKSSIYVDAFNLALDTVLEEEKHLFNETELAVFEHWQGLSYDAQYL